MIEQSVCHQSDTANSVNRVFAYSLFLNHFRATAGIPESSGSRTGVHAIQEDLAVLPFN